MRYLLDTHVLLWWTEHSSKLPAHVYEIIGNPDSEIYVSAITAWEIAIKESIGKLETPAPISEAMVASNFHEIPLTIEHTIHVKTLPHLHGDPFDRILIAQAMSESLTLITADSRIHRYDIATLWSDD